MYRQEAHVGQQQGLPFFDSPGTLNASMHPQTSRPDSHRRSPNHLGDAKGGDLAHRGSWSIHEVHKTALDASKGSAADKSAAAASPSNVVIVGENGTNSARYGALGLLAGHAGGSGAGRINADASPLWTSELESKGNSILDSYGTQVNLQRMAEKIEEISEALMMAQHLSSGREW
jgi:hypothetical protein